MRVSCSSVSSYAFELPYSSHKNTRETFPNVFSINAGLKSLLNGFFFLCYLETMSLDVADM